MRILVAGVGNVLRGDDGFGPAVAGELEPPPSGVEVLETGIGGMALLQELLAGWDGLVILDAVDRGTEPGQVFVIRPEVGEVVHVPDVHLANPERVLNMAKGLGVLPERLLIVGCQPLDADGLGEELSPPVRRAVPTAAAEVRRIVTEWSVSEAATAQVAANTAPTSARTSSRADGSAAAHTGDSSCEGSREAGSTSTATVRAGSTPNAAATSTSRSIDT